MQNLEVMVMLFTIVILGYAACKLGYMGDKFDKKLSSIVVDITCPLLVLSSVMGDEMPDRSLILPLVGVGFLEWYGPSILTLHSTSARTTRASASQLSDCSIHPSRAFCD